MADDRLLQRVAAETGLVRNADPVPETVVAEMVARDYDLRGALTRIATEKDDTFRLDTDDRPYLVKISSASEDPAIVDLQTAALVHMESVAPELPVQRLVRTPWGGSSIALTDASGPFPRTLTSPASRVDLRFLSWRRGVAQHRDLAPAGVLGQVGPHHRRRLAADASSPCPSARR